MRSVFRSYCNNKNWKLAFQILDKMILPLGMRIKKYSRETGSFTPPYSRWGWEQKYDLFQEFECPTDMSSPTSLATFQGQVLKLREQEGAFEGTWGGGPQQPPLCCWPLRCLCTVCPKDSGLPRSSRGATFLPRVLLPLPHPCVPTSLPSCFWFVFKTVKNKQHSLGCKMKEKGVGGPGAGVLSKAHVASGDQRHGIQGGARSHPHHLPSLDCVLKREVRLGRLTASAGWEWASLTSPCSPHSQVAAGLRFGCSGPEL